MESTAKKFEELMVRAGATSMQKAAKLLGYAGKSSIQNYYDESKYPAGQYLSTKIINKMLVSIEGLGTPPITKAEIVALGGMEVQEMALPTDSSLQPEVINITARSVIAEVQRFEAVHPDIKLTPAKIADMITGALDMGARLKSPTPQEMATAVSDHAERELRKVVM